MGDDGTAFTTAEVMVAAGAREIQDGQVVVVGIGIPLVSAVLAKRTHAPGMTILLELGVVDSDPVELGVGNADARIWHRATAFTSTLDVMGTVLHRGLVDIGFLGALEVDPYGNVNSTEVPLGGGRIRRFGGSGGGNDMASLARRTITIARHEPRKITEKLYHHTSPGHLGEGDARRRAGLPGEGPWRVITDMGVFGFHPVTRRMMPLSLHPGVTAEALRRATGFPLEVPANLPVTPGPTPAQLKLIREEIDPGRAFTGG
jgi:glutaconate CoA-transferase subunit B